MVDLESRHHNSNVYRDDFPGLARWKVRKFVFSGLVLFVSGSVLALLWILTYLTYAERSYSQMSEMMRRMMGQGEWHYGSMGPMLGYSGPIFLGLIILTLFSLGGVLYFAIFPEIRMSASAGLSMDRKYASLSLEAVMRTMTPDERRVIEILKQHSGRYLQKYIAKEAGLSRLKTHRIIARFSQRGVVSVKEEGNTNEITLSEWLSKQQ